jgi:putative cell wall-binding protein
VQAGRGGLFRGVLVLLVVTLAVGPGPALSPVQAEVTAVEPHVHTVTPGPGTLLGAGPAEIRAWVWSPDEIEHIALSIDGRPVSGVTLAGHDADLGTQVRAAAEVEAGSHDIRIEALDARGRQIARSWSFTATDRSARRLAGDTRIDTAARLSAAIYPDAQAAPAAVLARADQFADALAGAPLAASVGGPLLLTASDALPPATAEELRRALEPAAAVHILGGPAAVSEAVRREVQALGFRPVRHGGANRFETAAAVAVELPASTGAVLASGVSFPDALAVSAPAARDGLPVLLTAQDRLPDPTATALMARESSAVTIVGGPAAVGADVEAEVRALGPDVERLAGADRYATAVAVLDAFHDEPAAVSVASGLTFPDALAGARHAAEFGQPLLLTDPRTLSAPSAEALRRHRPQRLDVYGGAAAVSGQVPRQALQAAEDGVGGARVRAMQPSERSTVAALPGVTVNLDRQVDLAGSSVYVEVGGVELRGSTELTDPQTLAFRASADQRWPELDSRQPVSVAVRVRDTHGGIAHHEAAFAYFKPDPVFATAGPVTLHLPSRSVELVAFHEANHPGAQQQTPRATSTVKMTLPSRQRGTGSRSAADVVADPGAVVLAPVTGRVVRAGSYVLYCRYSDNFAVIDPDERPGWEVKVLHFRGLRVRAGDRVVAGETVLGDAPRQLPFRSQVDAYTNARDWPHLHVEVVDPSVPARPGGGC